MVDVAGTEVDVVDVVEVVDVVVEVVDVVVEVVDVVDEGDAPATAARLSASAGATTRTKAMSGRDLTSQRG